MNFLERFVNFGARGVYWGLAWMADVYVRSNLERDVRR